VKFTVTYNSFHDTYSIFWSIFENDNNENIEQWCDETFGMLWDDGVGQGLNYVTLYSKEHLSLFLLRWS